MSLPAVIEIVPLPHRVTSAVTVPGSKSITNRALILAALARGETILRGALWSEDTQVMVECLQELGYMITVAPDPNEPCNRTVTVYGKGAELPPGGTEEQPVELFVGNAGTAARFLAAFVCLGRGVYRLDGVPRMQERPQAALFDALRSLGYRVDSPNGKLPAAIHGGGQRPGKCEVSIHESSQFASALLLSAGTGGWQVTVSGEDAEEASYVTMTTKMVEVFSKTGGTFQVEPDASSGSYFLAIGSLRCTGERVGTVKATELPGPGIGYSVVSVRNWPTSGWQIDERFPQVIRRMAEGPDVSREVSGSHEKNLPGQTPSPLVSAGGISRARDLGDSIMTAIVIAPIIGYERGGHPIRFTDLGRLRLQECERVAALRTELTKCGAKVTETGDVLEVFPSALHGADIETYEDHRMAMCFAILGLKVPGIRIHNPACVKKTFPNFFQKLATPPPHGLGATIRDGRTGSALEFSELFAR